MAYDVLLVDVNWVLEQTLDRKRRQLEGEESEYADRLSRARQKEVIMRKAARARVRKKLVRHEATLTYDLILEGLPTEKLACRTTCHRPGVRRFCILAQ